MSYQLYNYLSKYSQKCPMNFKDFINQVLYHPTYGYYLKDAIRIERKPSSDFYTSESLGSVFTDLVMSSIKSLLSTDNLSEYHFIEIGAEPNKSLISKLDFNPFKKCSVIRPYDKIFLDEEPTILFANEWLDAIPFHRIIYKQNRWYERGIIIDNKNNLTETILDEMSIEVKSLLDKLPSNSIDGYQIDIAPEIKNQILDIFNQPWSGLMLIFDYGKTWNDIIMNMPQGSARTYHKHTQGTNLLEKIGEQDITADICWDFVTEALEISNITNYDLRSQESFFVNYSSEVIQDILSESKFSISSSKQTLLELIHPTNMGQRFQALYALK